MNVNFDENQNSVRVKATSDAIGIEIETNNFKRYTRVNTSNEYNSVIRVCVQHRGLFQKYLTAWK